MRTLVGLIAGLILGAMLRGTPMLEPLLAVAGPLGAFWLKALKMTILPLVIGLMFTGIVETAAAANAGVMAKRTLGLIVGVLAASTVVGGVMIDRKSTRLNSSH